MNSAHDLGGMDGLGPIEVEADEPAFHSEWERRVFGVMMGTFAGGHYNVDEFRHAIERMGAVPYLQTSYYEHWLHSMETLLVEKGILSQDELATGKATDPNAEPETPALSADVVPEVVTGGASSRIDEAATPKFKPGDRVTVRNLNPFGHTRVPRYARGKQGVVDRDHGVFGLPDTLAHGQGESAQHVYSVRFDATELWGDAGTGKGSVFIDLWDDYLDPR